MVLWLVLPTSTRVEYSAKTVEKFYHCVEKVQFFCYTLLGRLESSASSQALRGVILCWRSRIMFACSAEEGRHETGLDRG